MNFVSPRDQILADFLLVNFFVGKTNWIAFASPDVSWEL